MNKPLITVLVRVYNTSEKLLKRSLDSVLTQVSDIPKGVEILVLDDGSKEETLTVLRGYGSRIRLMQENHTGGLPLLNKGIEYAQGEYFMVVDSDDALRGGALKKLVSALSSSPTKGFAFGDYFEEEMETGKSTLFRVNGDILRSLVGGTLFSRKALKEAGGFNPGFILPDYDTFLTLQRKLGYAGIYIPEPFYIYARQPGSMTTASMEKMRAAAKQLTLKWGPLPTLRNY